MSSSRLPSPVPDAPDAGSPAASTPSRASIVVVTRRGDLVLIADQLHRNDLWTRVIDPDRVEDGTTAQTSAACILDLRECLQAAELVERHLAAGGPPLVCILDAGLDVAGSDVVRRRADEVVDADRLTVARVEVALARAIERHQMRTQIAAARRDRAIADANLRTLVATIASPVLVLDDDDRVAFANTAAERRFGRTAGDLCDGPPPTRVAALRARASTNMHDGLQALAVVWNDRPATLVVLAEPPCGADEPQATALAAVLAPIRDLQALSQALGARLEHAVDAVAKLRCVLARDRIGAARHGDAATDTLAYEVLDGLARDLGRALLSVHALTHSAAAQQAAAYDCASDSDR